MLIIFKSAAVILAKAKDKVSLNQEGEKKTNSVDKIQSDHIRRMDTDAIHNKMHPLHGETFFKTK